MITNFISSVFVNMFRMAWRQKTLVCMALMVIPYMMQAQRKTDALDRGLVGVKVNSGVYLSWRVQADEYYDVTYNIYRNGALIAQNLKASNYNDASGNTNSKYTVAAVKNGVIGTLCDAVTPWAQQYLAIPVADVVDRTGKKVWSSAGVESQVNYTINDIALGDVDGDGKIDFIVKRKNQQDQDELFPTGNLTTFCHIECYASSINYRLLWWIDCGPNICYGSDEQWDAVAFDWNEDGACEVIYRGGANTIIHHSDGTTETIGNVNENIRNGISHTANMTFANAGEEWLMYIDGRTGKTYDVIPYPLERGNAIDWGDGYGHRSSKYFVGAPYLDGVNPYIFLGRGIYTKTIACTYRVNKATNKLYKVGNTWNSYTNKGWYGQGYHNFAIADVDEDGCDEIIYGSMVLDFHLADNSLHGMSSTGLGHGDASHTSDLDPFRKGLETFACNEDDPAYNYRNAATCEIYARGVSSSDDGRSMAGNFTNQYPGGIGASTASGIVPLSYVQPDPYSPKYIDGMANDWNGQTPYPMALNFRIYWDGDLLDETINGPGSNESYLFVDKLGARIFDTGHGHYETACINYTKKNPCASGDILGDWREELVMRSADNKYIRVYTTVTPTEYRMPSLWYDHEYRQAMVWQTEGYNQPPHKSYFVGELEGLTQAHPPLTLAGRTIIRNNGTIDTSVNDKDVLIMPDGNGTEYAVTMTHGATPSTIFLHSRTTIEGGDQVQYKETKRTYDRIRLNGGAITGKTNIAKQGSSAAHLPNTAHTHTGRTDVWQGALICNGSFVNSPLWANIHTELFLGNALSSEASTYKSVEMEYGSSLFITNQSKTTPLPTDNGYAHMNVGDLFIKEGSRIVFDINGADNASGDRLNVMGKMTVRKQNWQYGPKYLAPVFEIRASSKLAAGEYLLGSFNELAEGSSLDNIIVECPKGTAEPVAQIYAEDGKYYLHVGTKRKNSGRFISGSTYYLYNVSTDKFLSRGSNYGYRAVVDDYGVPVVCESTDAGIRLRSADLKIDNTDVYYGEDGNMYADKKLNSGKVSAFSVAPVDDTSGFYTIMKSDGKYVYAVTSPSNQYTVYNDGVIGTNTSAEQTYWRFVSAEERNEIISEREAAMTKSEFVKAGLSYEQNSYKTEDYTDKINNSSLRTTVTGWTVTSNGNTTFKVGFDSNVGEVYEGAGSLSQTVSGLTPGLYRVSMYGFYRQGSNANCVSLTDYNVSTAYLQAGNNKVQLCDWASAQTGGNNPNSRSEANSKFNDGKYLNMVYAYVGSDGKLTISVVQPSMTKMGWLTFRDFRLELIKPIETGDDITGMIQNASFASGNAIGWTGNPTVNAENQNAEFFNTTFELKQTISNIPDGWYEVGVQAFYRNGKSGGKASKAMFYANNTMKYVRRLDSQTPAECGLSALPNTMSEAKEAFARGLYWNYLRVYVEDGTLTIGIKKPEGVSEDWTMFDNFTLKYLGAKNDDNDRTQYIANNSFESGSILYWSSINTGRESNAQENSNATYTIDIADGNYVFNSWDTSGTFGVSQTITSLPKGVYRLEAVLASDANNKIEININDEKAFDFTMYGPKSKGLVAKCDDIIITETADVLINIKSATWFKVDNIRLTYIGEVTEDILIAEAKSKLQQSIDEAKYAISAYPSGTRIFDYNTTSVNGIISAAEKAVKSSSTTREQINAQTNSIDNLVKNIAEGNSDISYNGPAANTRYNIMLSNKTVTFVDGKASALVLDKVNVNLIQAFILEADESNAYSYKLCFYDEKGTKKYLCTLNDANGVVVNEGDYTITVTSDVSKALAFGVERSAQYSSNGVFYLRNPKLGNNYLNSLDNSFKTGYVGNGKGNFTINVAGKAETTLAVNGEAEWGTFIAPYSVTIPDGVKAYTVLPELDGEFLALTEVTSVIPANTPVLLCNYTGKDITSVNSDYGSASGDNYQVGLLVGRYSSASLPVSDASYRYYVLQRQEGETSFCNIASTMSGSPYRCYLKLSSDASNSSRLRLPALNGGNITLVTEQELDSHIISEVCDFSGKVVNGIQKGVNIIRFRDGSVRKVIR